MMSNRYIQLTQLLLSRSNYSQKKYAFIDFRSYLNDLLKFEVWAQNSSPVKNAGYPISFVPGRVPALSYPFFETTGYIVQSLIKYQELYENPTLVESARTALDWLVLSANDDGSFPTNLNHFTFSKDPLIFDTGMILYGLVSGAKYFKDPRYYHAAQRSIAWLNDRFNKETLVEYKNTFAKDGRFRPYYLKVVHSLLVADQLCPGNIDHAVMMHIYEHVFSMMNNGMLISETGFSNNYIHLHTIAYTIEALLKISILTKDFSRLSSIKIFLDRNFPGQLPAAFIRWMKMPICFYRCQVGEAQMAEIFYIMSQYFPDDDYFARADDILANLASNSFFHEDSHGVYFYASNPRFGLYKPFEVVNWGAKFAADALMARENLMTKKI